MRLYLDPIATSCRPVIATVYALDLDIERVDLSLIRGQQSALGFQAVGPAGNVLALIDRDLTLTQSAAIARYLCDRTASPLGGRGAEGRALVNESLHWLASTIAVHFCQGLIYPRMLPQFRWADPAVAIATRQKAELGVRAALDHLEGHVLQNWPWLAGDELTIADFFGMSMLSLGEAIDFSFSDWPEVKDWMALVSKTPAWERLTRELRLLPISLTEH